MTAESKRSDQVKKPSASRAFIQRLNLDRTGNQRSGLTFAAIRFGSFFSGTNTRTPCKDLSSIRTRPTRTLTTSSAGDKPTAWEHVWNK
jgi:hypothetical protein